MQWNKRDLPNVISEEILEAKLNEISAPSFGACAIKGEGVFETLKSISKLVLLNIKGGLEK
jgi:signal recognition particle receptor subunit beta